MPVPMPHRKVVRGPSVVYQISGPRLANADVTAPGRSNGCNLGRLPTGGFPAAKHRKRTFV